MDRFWARQTLYVTKIRIEAFKVAHFALDAIQSAKYSIYLAGNAHRMLKMAKETGSIN